jgi:hypothetical protein
LVEWLVFCLGVGLSGLILVIIGRRRAGRFAVKTGSKVLAPDALAPDALVDERAWRLVGGAVTPSALGMLTASYGLAVLSVDESGVEVRVRPALLARAFGANLMRFDMAPETEVFPARALFGSSAVGFKSGDRECFFLTGMQAAVLARLHRSGFRVDSEERKIRY